MARLELQISEPQGLANTVRVTGSIQASGDVPIVVTGRVRKKDLDAWAVKIEPAKPSPRMLVVLVVDGDIYQVRRGRVRSEHVQTTKPLPIYVRYREGPDPPTN